MSFPYPTTMFLSSFAKRIIHRNKAELKAGMDAEALGSPSARRYEKNERNEKEEHGAPLSSFNSYNSYPGGSKVQWPDPPADEAFYGLAGDIVKAIEPHSEADPIAIQAQLLCAFGNVIGRKPYFIPEADKHYTNLYMTLVGKTAKARKGVSWGYVFRIFHEIDPVWRVQSGLSSGEGLIWAVRDPANADDLGEPDKRLLVMESEFASTLRVMGREGSTLSPVIRDAWDSGNLNTMTKNSPAKSTDAHISIVAHVTRDELRRYLDRTEAGNGFANRFLWICAKRSKVLPRGGNLNPEAMAPFIQRLREAVQYSQTIGEMTRDTDAWALWETVYEDLSDGKQGLFGAVTSRAEAQVTRLSCIYALLDKSAVVQKVHLQASLALWKYAEDSARFIFGDSLGYPIADAILAALRNHREGMTRTEISALFGRNKNSSEIDTALTALQQQGLARFLLQKTDGRQAEKWLAV